MIRILTAIILFMWMGCYLHCSAERLGLLGCETECELGVECDSEPQPGGSGDDDPIPCELCDYIASSGMEAPNFQVSIPDDAPTDLSLAQFCLVEPDLNSESYWNSSPPGGDTKLQEAAPSLCELLTRTSLPVRGPSVA